MYTDKTMTVMAGGSTHDHDVNIGPDLPSNRIQRDRKVSHNRLSKLMQFVLINAGDGIERAEIVAQYYGLSRRYCKYYTDPVILSGNNANLMGGSGGHRRRLQNPSIGWRNGAWLSCLGAASMSRRCDSRRMESWWRIP